MLAQGYKLPRLKGLPGKTEPVRAASDGKFRLREPIQRLGRRIIYAQSEHILPTYLSWAARTWHGDEYIGPGLFLRALPDVLPANGRSAVTIPTGRT